MKGKRGKQRKRILARKKLIPFGTAVISDKKKMNWIKFADKIGVKP